MNIVFHQSDKPISAGFRKRRNHTKSRNGCKPCRARHIKCDESQPCGQCVHRGVRCSFQAVESQAIFAISTRSSDLDFLIKLQGWRPCRSKQTYEAMFGRLPAVIESLCTKLGYQALLRVAPALLLEYPFFLHGLIGLAFAYTGAEMEYRYHIDLAMKGCNRIVQGGGRELDALFGTALLINVALYLCDGFEIRQWNYGRQWARSLSGPGLLLAQIGKGSYWADFAEETSRRRCKLGLDYMEKLRLGGVYEEPLRTLQGFGSADGLMNVILLMTFPSSMSDAFLDLLESQDYIALLLVGHWVTLLAELENCKWWCRDRAVREAHFVLAKLERIGGEVVHQRWQYIELQKLKQRIKSVSGEVVPQIMID